MYPAPFRYFRVRSTEEAIGRLCEEGEDARPLAGGQSLVPLMKLRFSRPSALVDLNFIPDLSYVQAEDGALRFGALTRHAEIEDSGAISAFPILHDCAAGIADVQVRNRGTIGGSVAEADPSGDWVPVLSCLHTEIACIGPKGERTVPLGEFVRDAYTTALEPGELVREVVVHRQPRGSGGAFLAFKRSAPVYATASAAVQLRLRNDGTCESASIYLGCVGLLAVRASGAERELAGLRPTPAVIGKAAEAAMTAAEPPPDIRGTTDYKRLLLGSLVRRGLGIAVRRARGEKVEVHHEYVGRD